MFIHRLCQALQEAKIPYAVVGGYAVALHGVPRGTFDIDCVIRWTLENLTKTERILQSLGLVSRLPIDAHDVFRFHDEYVNKRNLIAWNFYDPTNFSHQVDIIITFDLKNATVETIRTSGGNIKVLSRKDLIAMKRASGRPQDLADVRSLEEL
jgi:hypothetical protein